LNKTERPANRIQSSVPLNLGSFDEYQNVNPKMASLRLNEFLEAMEEWEGQIQDSHVKILEAKSTKKRSSKKV
jgi:hypothetical protein